jgi:flagellar hook-length control protein FliK
MSFDVDAFMAQPAPQPARAPRADTPAADDGPSFGEHLDEASAEAADTKPRADDTEKKDAAEPMAAPQAPPSEAAPPVVLQLIASAEAAPAAPVTDAPVESTAPVEADADAETPTHAPATHAAPVTQPHAKANAEPVAKNAEATAAPVQSEAKPATDAPKAATAEPVADANVETPAPVAAPLVQPSGEQEQVAAVAAPPVVHTLTPTREQSARAPSIDADAPRDGAEWAPKEAKPAPTTEKAPAPNTGAKADAPAPAAAKDNFAAMLAAQQQPDAPAANHSSSAALTHTALAASSAQQATPEAAALARAAPVATQVSREIVRRFNGETTFFELRLDPPDMGKIDVRLEVSRDHKVTAVVSADNPQALADLARNARDLQQALQSAGLELSDQGLSFDLNQQRESRGDASEAGASRRGAAAETETANSAAPLARPIGLESWRGVRVDVMA